MYLIVSLIDNWKGIDILQKSNKYSRLWLSHFRKRKFIVPLTILSIILILSVSIGSIWYAPESFLGVYVRDYQLISVVRQQQQSNAFFVSTPNDSNPPIVPETYFALMTLKGLHAGIPHISLLRTSLQSLEGKAEESLQQGHPIFGSREVYEDLMIRSMISLPVDQHVLEGYQQQIASTLVSSNISYSLAGIHDWYYAVAVVSITHSSDESQRTSALRVINEIFHQKTPPPLIAAALTVDAATLLHIPLDTSITVEATTILLHSRDPHGGFITSQTPDILSTYFAVLLASDVGRNDIVEKGQLNHYLATLREWNGYHMIPNAPVDPIATAYAIALRELLKSGDVELTPR